MDSKRVVTLLAVAALAACGGSDGSSSSTPTPTPTTPTTTSGFFITISGLAFTPLNLHVPPGGTVTVPFGVFIAPA